MDAMPEREFRELFRMTRHVFELLLFRLEDHIPLGLSSNGKSISPRLQLMIFLYYVTGDIPARHLAVAAGVKKSKCRWICIQMVEIIIESGFLDEYFQLPTEEQGRYEAKLLTQRSGMPEIFTGAVDGTQIDVWVKRRQQKLFFNRYKRKVINCMAYGGITGLFYALEASASGSRHDNAVFQGSKLYEQLKNGNLPFEGAKIVGDAAYTSDLPFMAIPFPDHDVKHNPEREKFNKKFRRLRSTVENDFGMWKGRFPVLQNGIKCKSVRKAGRLVMALGALNNFIVLQTTEQEMANATQQSNKERTGKRRKYRYRPHVDTSSSEEELDDQGRPKQKKRYTKKVPTSEVIRKTYF